MSHFGTSAELLKALPSSSAPNDGPHFLNLNYSERGTHVFRPVEFVRVFATPCSHTALHLVCVLSNLIYSGVFLPAGAQHAQELDLFQAKEKRWFESVVVA